MTAKQLKTLQQALEAKLHSLTVQGARDDDLVIEQTADPVDDAQSKSLRDLAVHVMNSDWATHKAIHAALERIENGEYGLCECCGEPIRLNRLKALPWAAQCVTCQEENEQAYSAA